MNRLTGVAAALMCAFVVGGCADDAPPPKTPADKGNVAPAEEEDVTKIASKTPEKSAITIDPKIMAMCEIPEAHFAFDSAALSDTARTALDALAKCFVDGPAKDKNMKLVGHADPRGEEEYNLALGHKRAGAVSGYLAKKALAETRMEISSRGELDATGTDEETWAADRKVEIFLGE